MTYTNLILGAIACIFLFLSIEWRMEVNKLKREIMDKELELFNSGEINKALRQMVDNKVKANDELSDECEAHITRIKYLKHKFKEYVELIKTHESILTWDKAWEALKNEFAE